MELSVCEHVFFAYLSHLYGYFSLFLIVFFFSQRRVTEWWLMNQLARALLLPAFLLLDWEE